MIQLIIEGKIRRQNMSAYDIPLCTNTDVSSSHSNGDINKILLQT